MYIQRKHKQNRLEYQPFETKPRISFLDFTDFQRSPPPAKMSWTQDLSGVGTFPLLVELHVILPQWQDEAPSLR